MKHHGPKLNRDWIGLRVKLTRRVENMLGTIAEGTAGTVTSYANGRLQIRFEADPCEHCRCALAIAAMGREDFTILTPPEEWKNTQGKGRPRHRRW